MTVVFWKELADHFSSRRFMILLIIIILSGIWGDVRDRASDSSKYRHDPTAVCISAAFDFER
jgi:ABC-type transport system involved in multi-copper enzyme maturation permease subunit